MSSEEFHEQGNQAYRQGDWLAAIDAYTKALAEGESTASCYSNRSAAYYQNRQLAEALEDAQLCLAFDPTYAKGYARKGTALIALKEYQDAIDTYRQGIETCGPIEFLTKGLAVAQRAYMACRPSSQQASQAARMAHAQRRASQSRKSRVGQSQGVSAFVTETRKSIKQEIALLQGQLELLDSLAAMDDEDKMDILFMTLDVDGDGFVSATELSNGVRKRHADLDINESMDRAVSMISVFDTDGDAKLNVDEFKTLVNTLSSDLQGTSFHELAEYLILQTTLLPAEEEVPQPGPTAVDDAKHIETSEDLSGALSDPRLTELFLLFDKSGDGMLSFKEVALGLYQLTRDIEGAVKSTLDLLLAMDKNDIRTLDFGEFARLILGFCTAAGTTFHDMADDLTLALSGEELSMTEDDLTGLYISDEYFQAATDLKVASKEEVKVEDILGYSRLLKLFAIVDENKDGAVDAEELAKGLTYFHVTMGMNHSAGLEASLLVLVSDGDGKSTLNQTEFARAMVKYADANNVDVHELIDFMCVSSVSDDSGYNAAVTQSMAEGVASMHIAEIDVK